MDARLRRRIQKLCDEYPNEIAEVLLESTFWLNELDLMTPYVRHDDDTRKGLIKISFSHDQDAWIEVWSEIDPDDVSFSHRFRVPLSGGGESPRVRNALLMLALAIKCDNQQIPQNRVS